MPYLGLLLVDDASEERAAESRTCHRNCTGRLLSQAIVERYTLAACVTACVSCGKGKAAKWWLE